MDDAQIFIFLSFIWEREERMGLSEGVVLRMMSEAKGISSIPVSFNTFHIPLSVVRVEHWPVERGGEKWRVGVEKRRK
jgi:hypothetical protein